ncbi:hypothetical protein NXS19_003685 [Fusarium pseudograminearum]|nr:hypothetical protein NXS19_003685 [Fusarium pseudograminearum]
MTSSIAGRNGLPDSLGTDREHQVVANRKPTATTTVKAAASPPAVTPSSATATSISTAASTATATATQTPNAMPKSPVDNDDKRDQKVTDPTPASVSASAPAPSPAMGSISDIVPELNSVSNPIAADASSSSAPAVAAPAGSSVSTSTSVPAPASSSTATETVAATATATAPLALETATAAASTVPSNSSQAATSTATLPDSSNPRADLASSISPTKTSASQPPPSTPPPSHANPSGPSPEADIKTSVEHQKSEAPSNDEASALVKAESSDQMMPDAPSASDTAVPLSAHGARQSTPLQLQMSADNMGEPFAPSTPYNSTPMPTINQHAYMMMALATMSGAPSAMSPLQLLHQLRLLCPTC